MLHLIAETASGYSGGEHGMLSTERLVLEMGLMDMKSAPLHLTEKLKKKSDVDVTAPPSGESDSVVGQTKHPFHGKEKAQRVVGSGFLQDDILYHVLSFMSWRSVLQMRGVSKQFLSLSLSFVTVCRLPHSEAPVLFIPCHEDLMANEAKVEAELYPTRRPCELLKYGPLSDSPANVKTCESPFCSEQRIFIGQLRRDGTVPMIKWLLRTVLEIPSELLVAVENHRNRTSKRGKGCVWLTLRDGAASEVISYHHRVFFDKVHHVEGVWLVPPRSKEQLFALATARGNLAGRSKQLPRGTLVVETPNSAASPATTSVSWSTVSTTHTSMSPSPTSSPSSQFPFQRWKNCQQLRGLWRHNPYSFTSPISYILPP
ncbi:uncharacterized protein Tco025E_08584 [Trypanosoma conorhini]|uniref:F-box domain-containing protein n=1 Tax=Trypanosoma conorhini TaxID=83891 RepID=A0A422N7P3_9TRYP|nr:uncharacterized protein Tco025E_08584 [Trypanosoma conorhini]RNF01471.1 hypothetical protein Tco025E_08584 [Trypanosoma conorhini]